MIRRRWFKVSLLVPDDERVKDVTTVIKFALEDCNDLNRLTIKRHIKVTRLHKTSWWKFWRRK